VSRPPVEVRKACVDDLDDLLLLWTQAREELSRSFRPIGALPAEQLRPRLRDVLVAGHPPVLVARYEGAPAGYALLRLAPVLAVDEASLHVDFLYVVPSLRRHGVARALLLAVTAIAERNGADQVLAGALPTARDTHRFLARLGFSPLVTRRVTATAALRRRLSGEESRRGLEDLLSRRRSLRARALRSAWPGTGRSFGGRRNDSAEACGAVDSEASRVGEVSRGGGPVDADE
jgi:GNAT superfamily N-acetyltransferase